MDILGIGNALLDVFFFSDDETALSLGLHPNHASHVSSARMDELLLAVPAPILVSGGGAANALKAAAALGADCLFAGCTGTAEREKDRWATAFAADLATFGVKTLIENRPDATGRCLVIRMPGGMKSIACAPGAAATFRVGQIPESLMAEAKTVFIDGHMLRNEAIVGALTGLCRARGLPLAIDVGSADIARNHAKTFLQLITENQLTLFMNQDESLALAQSLETLVPGDRGMQSPHDFTNEVWSFFASRKKGSVCLVEKRDKRGARAWLADRACDMPPQAELEPLDDTGSGDVFDGTFLVARQRGRDLSEALALANRAAGEALAVPGTQLDKDRFAALKASLT